MQPHAISLSECNHLKLVERAESTIRTTGPPYVSNQSSSEIIDPLTLPALPMANAFSSPDFVPPPPPKAPPPSSVQPPQVRPPQAQPPRSNVAPPVHVGGPEVHESPRNDNFFDFESLNRFSSDSAGLAADDHSLAVDEEEAEKKDSIWAQLLPMTLQETPSWMVSLVVHVALILLLALIPLSGQVGSTLSLIIGVGEDAEPGDELSVFEATTDSLEVTESSDPTTAMAEPSVMNLMPEDFAPKLDKPDLTANISIKNGLKGRTGAMKGALLKAYGGTQGTEDAVALGLQWLARNQRPDGSWSLVGPFSEGGITENKPAATAMAMLAFMGAGNTHETGQYSERLEKAIMFLMKLQNAEGFFAEKAAGNQQTYAHAQCTMAICELYGMTGDEKLRDVAQKAVRYCEKAQAKNGGWRYQPREGGDTSVTGWYVMALISARMAGLDVDSEVLERVHQFLDTVQRKGRTNEVNLDGERYAYQSYSTPTPAMTAEGMLCRLYLGWDTKDPRIMGGADLLVSNPMALDEGRISFYYWYYATTTLHHMGGQAWAEWNESMKVVLPKLQVKIGKEAGSWPTGQDAHAAAGGRLYSTCFALYCLESYYRHLPLSEMAPH